MQTDIFFAYKTNISFGITYDNTQSKYKQLVELKI